MRIDATRLVKIGLFACLALTFWKGLTKLPEVLPLMNPEGFKQGQVNDGENSLFMKQRHFDFNYQTGKALGMRVEELKASKTPPPAEALVTLERAENALRKTMAKDLRNANDLALAEEKLGRAKRRAAEDWSLGVCCPAGTGSGMGRAAKNGGADNGPDGQGNPEGGSAPDGRTGASGANGAANTDGHGSPSAKDTGGGAK